MKTEKTVGTGTTGKSMDDDLMRCIKTLADFDEEEAEWLIDGWMGAGEITLLAADGGVGKTSIWVNLIAAISSGRNCILDQTGYAREPQTVAFLTAEDSVSKKLLRKLRLAGANLENIVTMDVQSDRNGVLSKLTLGSPEFAQFVRAYRPALCVIDPIQGFLPERVNMGQRNDMRRCMAPLAQLGEEVGTSFLVICHSNKRGTVYARTRIADSADLWDIARSVWMAGYTGDDGARYLSQEKNNYGPLQETVLFDIAPDGAVAFQGTTWKRDREYVQDTAVPRTAPKRDDCKAYMLRLLTDAGSLPSQVLADKIKGAGYSQSTFRDARDELSAANQIEFVRTGSPKGGDSAWHTRLVTHPGQMDLLAAGGEVLPF